MRGLSKRTVLFVLVVGNVFGDVLVGWLVEWINLSTTVVIKARIQTLANWSWGHTWFGINRVNISRSCAKIYAASDTDADVFTTCTSGREYLVVAWWNTLSWISPDCVRVTRAHRNVVVDNRHRNPIAKDVNRNRKPGGSRCIKVPAVSQHWCGEWNTNRRVCSRYLHEANVFRR